MEFLRKLAVKINGNVILRNVVLAVCAVLVFVAVCALLLNIFTRHGQIRKVPDFSGMTIQEAQRAGRFASLDIGINDSLYVPAHEGGVILAQNPAPGAEVKSGRRIFVTINSFKQKMVVIPYVAGYSLRQAKNNLDLAGLEIAELIYRTDMATNNVLEERYEGQVIRAGNKIEAEVGSGITLIVGKAPDVPTQPVPGITGLSLREARNRLGEAGFNVGSIIRDEGITLLNENEAQVYTQSPGTGTYSQLGTVVSFAITTDDKKIEQGLAAAERDARAAAEARAAELQAMEEEENLRQAAATDGR